MDELKVNVTTDKDVVTVITGEALQPQPPRIVNIAGIVSAPADWAANRTSKFDVKQANIVVNYTERTITLVLDEKEYYNTTITGKLELHPDLSKLGINATKTYGEKELYKTLRFLGNYFASREEYDNLMQKLQAFKAKVTQAFTNTDDYVGNAAQEKITTIEHEIPLNFVLGIPIFTGGPKHKFKVQICVTARAGGVEFWLESVELHELVQELTESVFETELARFDKEIVVVKKY